MADSVGFFQRIFGSLFGSNDPETEKKRLLRSIAKALSKSKFHFYRINSHSVEPSMAKFFYEIYKAVSPVQQLFQSTTPNAMKNVVIDTSLSEKQKAILEELTEANIEALSSTMPVKVLEDKIHKDIDSVNQEFQNGKADEIDDLYNKLSLFRNFCTFDFYFLLRKFDSSLKEHDFAMQPHFQSISGTYILEDLKNFLAVAWVLPFDGDWNSMFTLLKRIKGTEPISPSLWKKILSRLRMLKESAVFEMMIQLISDDPLHEEAIRSSEEHIVDSYIKQLETQTNALIKKLRDKQTTTKVDSLLSQIFGAPPETTLKNYTPQNSAPFERKSLGSYLYSAPLGYLKSFLIDFAKRDMRELSDILLIRGKWAASQLSSPMSEAYNNLLDISNQIMSFDARLSEEVDVGLKLKTFLPRADRDKDAANIIRTILGDVNEEAGTIITEAGKNFIVYGRNLKALIEDYQKGEKSDIIINWRELERHSEQNLKTMTVSVYKKIYLFVTLLQNFTVENQ